jgi:hypothetical protein
MSNDKTEDKSKVQPTKISSIDKIIKSDDELREDELKRVSGGTQYNISQNKKV